MKITERQLHFMIREAMAGQGHSWCGVRENDEETRKDALLRNGGVPDAAMQWLMSKMGTAVW